MPPSPCRKGQHEATDENEDSGDWQNQVNHAAECEPFKDLGRRRRRAHARHDGDLQAESDKQADYAHNVE